MRLFCFTSISVIEELLNYYRRNLDEMSHPDNFLAQYQNMNNSTIKALMELVLTDLKWQEKLNIRETATKHGLVKSTLQKVYKKAPSELLIAKLFRANKRLAVESFIGTHVILGLTAALREEKRRKKRGKRLNLLEEEESEPQFFSPERVTASRT